jgi:hypothetical protein
MKSFQKFVEELNSLLLGLLGDAGHHFEALIVDTELGQQTGHTAGKRSYYVTIIAITTSVVQPSLAGKE